MKKVLPDKIGPLYVLKIIKYVFLAGVAVFFIIMVFSHKDGASEKFEKEVAENIKGNLEKLESTNDENKKTLEEHDKLTENTIKIIDSESVEDRLNYLRDKGVIKKE